MEFFSQLFSNKILWTSIFACFLAQFIKIFTGKEKRIDFSRIVMSGGMPSSHSAVVATLTTLIGQEYGVESGIFAMSCVFSAIVMYDAAGVRRAAGKQATLLNKLVENATNSGIVVSEKLVEVLGHTPLQVLVGAIIGVLVGLLYGMF